MPLPSVDTRWRIDVSMAGRRVLVTGATGFIGAHLLQALVEAGSEVHALRRHGGAVDLVTPHVTRRPAPVWHDVDVLDRAAMMHTLHDVSPDTVFHLAAYGARPAERDLDRMVAVNVHAPVTLWQSLPPSVSRMIVAGTSREYAKATRAVEETYPCGPVTLYSATKHAGITLLRALAAREQRAVTVLRLFGPYGPGDTSARVIPFTIAQLLAGKPVPLSSGSQQYDFAYIDDHVMAFLLAATVPLRPGWSVYNIGGGVPRLLREVVEAVAECIGTAASDRLHFSARPTDDDGLAVCGDISAARRELGYVPATPLRTGIARTVRWWRESAASRAVS